MPLTLAGIRRERVLFLWPKHGKFVEDCEGPLRQTVFHPVYMATVQLCSHWLRKPAILLLRTSLSSGHLQAVDASFL